MGNAWDKAKETADRISKESKVFVRLENDGDKVVGAFLGDPHTEEVVWNEKTSRNETFTKQHEAAGKKPSAKFSVNFYTISEGNGEKMTAVDPPVMRVYQCSLRTFNKVLKSRDKYGLENKFFEIERQGKKGDTDTVYSILPDSDIPSELKSTLAKAAAAHEAHMEKGTLVPEGILKLHDLAKIASGEDESDKNETKKNGAGSPYISSEKAESFKVRLKQLPRAEIDKFLARFGVKAIKEVKVEDADKADAFIGELEGKGKPAAAAPAEIDPFA